MNLSKANIKKIMIQWAKAWNRHDLNEVMKIFHEDVVFENWSDAKVKGKDALQKAWTPWFENHGNFQFILEALIIDDYEQKVIWQWSLYFCPSISEMCLKIYDILNNVLRLLIHKSDKLQKTTIINTNLQYQQETRILYGKF